MRNCQITLQPPIFDIFAPMQQAGKKPLRIAILDLYNGHPNEGMRCIRQILEEFSTFRHQPLQVQEYDVRRTTAVPDLSFDIYISSGGPGSPFDGIGEQWEANYFQWLENVLQWNNNPANRVKKHVFFICHSFQMACRYFQIATVCKRKSTAFGIFPVHRVPGSENEPVLQLLPDPFYAVDSRDYQVVQPDFERMQQLGAQILCIEKYRPHVPLERAIMAIRFNAYMIGTQFHPEADAIGMSMYLQRADKKQTIIENHGYEKWKSMIEHLEDPDKILWTYTHILPNFLQHAANQVLVESKALLHHTV
ncbi:MAG: type 1 glutamine amidotransferase [Lacibacter sp.]|jgi:GMP synthase-like glutamine amidotransferase